LQCVLDASAVLARIDAPRCTTFWYISRAGRPSVPTTAQHSPARLSDAHCMQSRLAHPYLVLFPPVCARVLNFSTRIPLDPWHPMLAVPDLLLCAASAVA